MGLKCPSRKYVGYVSGFNNNLLVVWGKSGFLGQDQSQNITLVISFTQIGLLGWLQRQDERTMNYTPCLVFNNLTTIRVMNNGNGNSPPSQLGYLLIGV